MPLPTATHDPNSRTLLREVCYTRILELIETQTLLPGEHLLDGDLQEWLGMSRTPIREALNRLALDGLVRTNPQRSTRVTGHSFEELQNDLRLLYGIYELAARWAQFGDTEIATVRTQLQRLREEIDASATTRDLTLRDLHDLFIVNSDPSIDHSVQRLRTRVTYASQHALALIPWDAVRTFTLELEAALEDNPCELANIYARLGIAEHTHLQQLAEHDDWQTKFLAEPRPATRPRPTRK